MNSIIFNYATNDTEFVAALHDKFKDQVEFPKIQKFDGNTMVQAIVFISSLGDIVDFIMNHFTKNDKNKRFILDKGKSINLEGYSKDDVIDIVKIISEKNLL